MKNYYWSKESWGDAYPPENADEIIDAMNADIDEWIAQHPDAEDCEISDYAEKQWAFYCAAEDTVQDIIERGLFAAAVELMDDNIREYVHEMVSPCSESTFLLYYMFRHWLQYGVDFVI